MQFLIQQNEQSHEYSIDFLTMCKYTFYTVEKNTQYIHYTTYFEGRF